MTEPRLVIKKSTKEAWLDGRRLDLTDESFATLLVLAQSRVDGEPYVTEEELTKRVAALLRDT